MPEFIETMQEFIVKQKTQNHNHHLPYLNWVDMLLGCNSYNIIVRLKSMVGRSLEMIIARCYDNHSALLMHITSSGLGWIFMPGQSRNHGLSLLRYAFDSNFSKASDQYDWHYIIIINNYTGMFPVGTPALRH